MAPALDPVDIDQVARFIAERQRRPESHMAMLGEEQKTIVAEIDEYVERLYVERDGSDIVGVAGYEHAPDLARGYVYGPWAIDEDWDAVADRAFANLETEIPKGTRELDVAFNVRNEHAQRFADRHGFDLVREHLFMMRDRSGANFQPDNEVRSMSDADRARVVQLHEQCFPGVWPSGAQLLEDVAKSPDRHIFVVDGNERLDGYVYARVDRSTGDAAIENLGVDASVRGRGLARRLFAHGLWWIFQFDEVEEIELSVRAENTAAIKLYDSAGFRTRQTIRQTRKALVGRS